MARRVSSRVFRAWVPVLLLLMMGLAGVTAVQAQGGDDARFVVRSADLEIPSHDGVVLAARLTYRSYVGDGAATVAARETPVPAVLATHGWAESKDDVDHVARRIAAELGFPVLVYDSRGFGDSGGVVGLNGPAEQADVSWLVDWLVAADTSDAWPDDTAPVLLDDEGDPRLGMVGRSYAGAIQLLAAARDDRIDAVVPQITWHDLTASLAPGDVVKRGWVDLLFFGGAVTSTSGGPDGPDGDDTGGLDPRLAGWYAEVQRDGRLPEDAKTAFVVRSPAHTLDRVGAHVLLVQGWRDTLFSPAEAAASYATLATREDAVTRLLFHDGGHGHSLSRAAQEEVDAAVDGFLGAMLLAEDEDAARAEAAGMPPVVFQRAGGGGFVPADTWTPGAVAWGTVALPGTGRTADGAAFSGGTVTLYQAAAPTSHTQTAEVRAADAVAGEAAPVPTSAVLDTGIGGPQVFLGPVSVRLSVSPEVDDLTLFLSLVETRADGSERVLSDQVTAVRLEGAAGDTVALEHRLVPIHGMLGVGGSLGVRVATGDSAYHGGREAGPVTISLEEGALAVPWLDDSVPLWVPPEPLDHGDAEEAPSVGLVGSVALVALFGVLLRRWRWGQ